MPLYQRILDTLVTAQAERPARQLQVHDPVENCSTFAWVLHERDSVLKVVNSERAANGLGAIDETLLVRKAEWLAAGHSDYTLKYALYAADLAAGRDALKV